MAGVTRAYRLEFPVQASAGVDREARRLAYTEALQGLSKQEREAMEEASHILQDMGFLPPEAHRWVRAVKAGRRKPFELTPEQDRQLRERLVERRELQADPARARALLSGRAVGDG
ncbi:hypothetical protein GS931_21575 [Rhodococcus hoagii]|nr:hypothetical protein [Prescottella equi]